MAKKNEDQKSDQEYYIDAEKSAKARHKLANTRLTRTHDRYKKLLATAGARGLISAEQLVKDQALIKQRKRVRQSKDVHRIENLAERYDARCAQLHDLVGEPLPPAAEFGPPEGSKTLPTKAGMDSVAEKKRLVDLVLSGRTPQEAIDELDSSLSVRTAQRAVSAYRTHGKAGLEDGRTVRTKRKRRVMTKELRDLLMGVYHTYPLLGATGILQELRKVIAKEAEHLEVPSVETVRREMKAMGPATKAVRSAHPQARSRDLKNKGTPTLFQKTDYGNKLWQADGTDLDLWAVDYEADGTPVLFRPWLTQVLDVHSRSVVSYCLIRKGKGGSMKAIDFLDLLLEPCQRGPGDETFHAYGCPEVVQTDRGPEFDNTAVDTALAQLKVKHLTYSYQPQKNGKVERMFRTVLDGFARKFRTHVENVGTTKNAAVLLFTKQPDLFPTIEQVRELFEAWVRGYHNRPHTGHGMRKRTPREVWLETAVLRTAESPDELLGLRAAFGFERKARRRGIEITWAGDPEPTWYWHPRLVDEIGSTVFVARSNDRSQVEVYNKKREFICTAQDVSSGAVEYEEWERHVQLEYQRRKQKAHNERDRIVREANEKRNKRSREAREAEEAKAAEPTVSEADQEAQALKESIESIRAQFRALGREE